MSKATIAIQLMWLVVALTNYYLWVVGSINFQNTVVNFIAILTFMVGVLATELVE